MIAFGKGENAGGAIVNTTRNLARQIWVSIDEKEPEDKNNKIDALNLLVAFGVATKLHLRGEPINNDLEELMPDSYYIKLKIMNNPPLEVAFWISDYLQQQYNRHCIKSYQLTSLQELLNILVDNLGSCERILRTQMPLAYAIHLKQLLLLYCFLLPFQIVQSLGWWTGLISALVSFTLLGIEAIGLEIENPFGYDENDLPSAELKRILYEEGKRMLHEMGYDEIGMDHFALKSDNLHEAMVSKSLHRNFMGYTAGKTKLMIGLGMS